MKLLASALKSLKENIRDWKVLLLVLGFAPFFLLLMFLFYGGDATTYQIGIANLDAGESGAVLARELEDRETGFPVQVRFFDGADAVWASVTQGEIDLGLVLPAGYSENISGGGGEEPIALYGSVNNPRYGLAAILVNDGISRQMLAAAGLRLPIIAETFLETKAPKNEFEAYVPGLLSLSVLMVLFSAAGSIVKENDQNTLTRLKLSPLGSLSFLGGVAIVQALLALIATVISYGTALALGYESAGGFAAVLLVAAISSFAMVAVSLLLASFLRSVFDVLTIGCLPFFIMMFFSGSMFPLPKLHFFTIAGHPVGLFDLLPLTHTAAAFQKILNGGAGIGDVFFEIFLLLIVSALYFALGIFFYQKRRLSKA